MGTSPAVVIMVESSTVVFGFTISHGLGVPAPCDPDVRADVATRNREITCRSSSGAQP